jgi:hypothetical protein
MLLTVIVPVFAVIVLGRVAVPRRWIEPAALPGLNDIVFYAAMPSLLLTVLGRATWRAAESDRQVEQGAARQDDAGHGRRRRGRNARDLGHGFDRRGLNAGALHRWIERAGARDVRREGGEGLNAQHAQDGASHG